MTASDDGTCMMFDIASGNQLAVYKSQMASSGTGITFFLLYFLYKVTLNIFRNYKC